MSESDRRREDSVYGEEHMVPERLLADLDNTPVMAEGDIDNYSPSHHKGTLTPPELQIVELLAHGYSTAMMAQELSKSPETIRSQLASARSALNAKTRSHLVAIAFRKHLID